jgi:hypothetical protein
MDNPIFEIIAQNIRAAAGKIPALVSNITYLKDIGENTSKVENELAELKSKIKRHIDALKKQGINIVIPGVQL